MRVARVRLENFKCYSTADVQLPAGVTVIHGPNGAGKSSLLEAVFFALYGASALDTTLDDLVTRGAEAAEIELWFSHDGHDYHLERRIRATGERAQTASCVLETPDGEIEGATDVRETVVSLLRMDAEAFVNCAYVQQGEVNKLISATPSERQAMLDELLQLGTLERYRERAANARLGVEDVLGEIRGQTEQLAAQIEEKKDQELPQALNALETELASVTADIERFEDNREAARETLEAANDMLEQHQARQEELADVEDGIETLRDRIAETEQERETVTERIADRRERADELEAVRDDLVEEAALDAATPQAVSQRRSALEAELEALTERKQSLEIERTEAESELETASERADELEAEAEQARDLAAELSAEIEATADELTDRRESLDALDDEIEALEATFEEASIGPDDAEGHRESLQEERETLRSERNELHAALETARHQVEHAEGLLEAGKCPECGQSVTEAPRVDSLEEDRERVAELEAELEAIDDRLAALDEAIDHADELVEAAREIERLSTERANVAELLDERESTIEEKRERVSEARDRAATLDERAEDTRRTAAEAESQLESLEGELETVAEERDALEAQIDTVEDLAECLEKLDAIDEAIDRLEERRALLADRNEERRETLSDKRDRRNELADVVDEERIETARADRERAKAYLEEVEPKLDRLREQRDELQGQIGAVENELEALETLRERHAAVTERLEHLESLAAETSELETVYGDLRAELRQRNITNLERLLNETFELVYQNDAYARIELDEDYALTVYQKDGEALAPDQLSGGERALFNLSLRTAIYRLLSEGIEGAAPMPPLILDEPTVFLDAGHVSQLVALIESMRDLGVEQIVVVSHDEELIGAADELLTVRKDATSNRSTVERGAQPELVAD